ncbi:hypothetical protein [Chamaesiphon sp. VAR_48_metabat_403]|uniref:hypothetical protein n=1 Tax=Chamaesiphon sp. VAR_48_metabat_403 TaxID=2964700 RepID=UPI00286E8880|nr:hypothetical protein [Chamaesiphon sp. VAR_48_metabat_403]
MPLLRLLFNDRPISQTDWSKITTLEIRSLNQSDLDRKLLSLNRTKQRQISTKLYPLMHKLSIDRTKQQQTLGCSHREIDALLGL